MRMPRKEPGEIPLRFYKVYYECAMNFGFEPIDIKYFKEPKMARRYARKLVKSLLEPSAKESDDFESVIIEDENGEVLEMWRAEYGKVIYYQN